MRHRQRTSKKLNNLSHHQEWICSLDLDKFSHFMERLTTYTHLGSSSERSSSIYSLDFNYRVILIYFYIVITHFGRYFLHISLMRQFWFNEVSSRSWLTTTKYLNLNNFHISPHFDFRFHFSFLQHDAFEVHRRQAKSRVAIQWKPKLPQS